MSSFLHRLPRRLPVALAHYIAFTEENDKQRCAIAKRIYTALPAEQQTEISRLCEAMGAHAQQTGNWNRGGTVVALREHLSQLGQARRHH